MPDPQLKFDREELTLEISGLTGGWPIGRLGELSLFDSATVQFPSSWSQFQIGVATQVIDTQWRLTGNLVLEQTLEAGIEFTRADGVGSSIALDTELKYHLMERPTTQIDLYLNVQLDGEFDGSAFNGSGVLNLGVSGRF